MTTEQSALLRAALLNLELHALEFAYALRDGKDTLPQERKLAVAAKTYAETVNKIDPNLWEPVKVPIGEGSFIPKHD